jgi:hypothetical protein
MPDGSLYSPSDGQTQCHDHGWQDTSFSEDRCGEDEGPGGTSGSQSAGGFRKAAKKGPRHISSPCGTSSLQRIGIGPFTLGFQVRLNECQLNWFYTLRTFTGGASALYGGLSKKSAEVAALCPECIGYALAIAGVLILHSFLLQVYDMLCSGRGVYLDISITGLVEERPVCAL